MELSNEEKAMGLTIAEKIYLSRNPSKKRRHPHDLIETQKKDHLELLRLEKCVIESKNACIPTREIESNLEIIRKRMFDRMYEILHALVPRDSYLVVDDDIQVLSDLLKLNKT